MELYGKRAIVTGGGNGIGKASALRLAGEGAAVAVVDRDEAAAAVTVAAIEQAGGRALALRANVTRRGEVDAMVERVRAAWGGVDVLLNNAGGSLTSHFLDLDEDEWDQVVDLNLKAAYLCSRPVARLMVEQRAGRIVNVTSNYGVTGSAVRAHYSAAKAGIIGLTKAMALELAPYGITVNAVGPGPTATERVRGKYTAEEWAERGRGIPMGRCGEPEDIAEAVVFLASDRARYITGQTLHVNGGLVMP
ncbi:MAG TPA: SDR family NAD(P)-dependent oxidoreductase [Chloroflexota bacterium]|nr:SDR family NAD(P)-dependent oxidoreductase [Chloroflexota bacterium]